MMKHILLLSCVILLLSCRQSKQKIVNDYLDAINCYDKEKIDQLLSDSFVYYGVDALNKIDYLTKIDSLRNVEQIIKIQKIQDLDSIVKTEEIISSIIDSLLEITPYRVQRKTYNFSDDKLKSITIDSISNYEEYIKSFNERMIPFAFYVYDKYNIKSYGEIIKNVKQYLSEYSTLPLSDKKQYGIYANLQGIYVSKDNPIYKKLIFRGKKTVTIIDGFFGLPFASSYEIDENLIKIRTDKSDLLFEIQDSRTLIGEGFAKGTYIRRE